MIMVIFLNIINMPNDAHTLFMEMNMIDIINMNRCCIRMGDYSHINKPIIHEFFGVDKNDPTDYKCAHCGYSLISFSNEKIKNFKYGDEDDL